MGAGTEAFVFTASTAASFQVFSENRRGTLVASRAATAEEVRITRFRVVPYFKAEFKIVVVPCTAGTMRSECLIVNN